jgi:hypothetical protein
MKEELEKKIYERWPKWFRPQGPITETLIPFGLPGDGWFQIIWDLCESLEPYTGDDFEVVQVKEKFGGLRFYTQGGGNHEKINEMINVAEAKAYETCEYCGAPGKSRGGPWIKTLCDACGEQRKTQA